jgi:hypothetical protein
MKLAHPLRIVALEAANIKAIRAVAIVPDGRVVQITGANGAGKSSVIDSIFYALAGKKALPSEPVRAGEDSAYIYLDMGEVMVTRRFGADGKTDLVVEAQNGARFQSPQRMLDELLGELSFDPLKFASAEPRAQLETLRGLVKLDVDVDALDGLNAQDYELRRDVNRDAKSLAERVVTLAEGLDLEMDVTPIDVSELTAQMAAASAENSAIMSRRTEIASLDLRLKELHSQRESIRAEIERLEEKYDRIGQDWGRATLLLEEKREADAAAIIVDVRELQEQINEAGKTNSRKERQHQQRNAYAAAVTDLADKQATSNLLSDRMDERTAEKTAAIARAKMPVEGLSFGNGEVRFGGKPFAQASQAERIRVSFAVAMAMNPQIRVALIRDGSLLDSKNLALIEQMAEEHDFQVFLERVDESGKIGIMITDGEVTSIDGVPVERFEADDAVDAVEQSTV